MDIDLQLNKTVVSINMKSNILLPHKVPQALGVDDVKDDWDNQKVSMSF